MHQHEAQANVFPPQFMHQHEAQANVFHHQVMPR